MKYLIILMVFFYSLFLSAQDYDPLMVVNSYPEYQVDTVQVCSLIDWMKQLENGVVLNCFGSYYEIILRNERLYYWRRKELVLILQ